MVGYTITKRGRYKCDFCDHDTYKTAGGINNHINDRHLHSYQLAQKDAQIERLKNLPPRVEVREKVVYRDAPKPAEKKIKYWYGPAGVYCRSCMMAMRNPGIPVGQTVEGTPCACGNRTLMLITGFK